MSSTKTQQPYFPHYANSRNEDSMIRLRMAHGVAGYGVYHMLMERLRLSTYYQAELDYDILCWDLDCDQELIRSVIYDFGLFEIVCEGQKFQSPELNAYMRVMEEKKRERSEKAKAAADARWGNRTATQEPVSPVIELPMIPELIEETPEQDSTERLDKEIEIIKKDETWIDAMAKECGKTKEELGSFLKDFKTACVLKGLKGGHKNMEDTFSHFRSWIYKSGRAKDPKSTTSNGNKGKTSVNLSKADAEALERLDRQIKERNEEDYRQKRTKRDPSLYIKNLGYDPEVVGMAQAGYEGWRANNPPTHPEWIGKFEPELFEAI